VQPDLPVSGQPEQKGPDYFKQIDHTLSRYVSVWLWSLIFGANSTVLLTIASFFRSASGLRELALLLGIVLGLAALSALSSLYSLVVVFRVLLVPTFLNWRNESLSPGEANERSERSGRMLINSLVSLVVAFALTVFAAIAQFALGAYR
jgi:hypothetical protein